jgi:1,2-diacylglycerol 3-alpha-glucosyltransferase
MRIGIFTDTYPPYINGVSTSIAMLESALIKQGHQVFIVTVNPEDLHYKFSDDERIIRLPGIPIGIYDYRLTGIYPLKAVSKIKSWNLDVIHSHTEFGVGTFARIMAKQLDIPIVHTYHTMYEDYIHYITKGYFDGPSKKIVEYLTNFYCDKTVTELIVPTQKTYNLFKEKYEYERNIHIVPTGIEVERFYAENNNKAEVKELRRQLGLSDDDFVLLFVGRLAAEKNVTFLIENHQILARENGNCKLLIIGDGPDIEFFKTQARKLNIQDNVIFTGKVPWEQIHKYYQIPNVFVTASHTETQGLTLLEAMAASVPVVAYDDEAFRTVVVHDLNGYLFKDKKDYRKYIKKIMTDKKVFERLSRQARIQGESHSSKYYAEKILDVYYTALGGRKDEGGEKEKKTFFSKMKNVVKKGFNGK